VPRTSSLRTSRPNRCRGNSGVLDPPFGRGLAAAEDDRKCLAVVALNSGQHVCIFKPSTAFSPISPVTKRKNRRAREPHAGSSRPIHVERESILISASQSAELLGEPSPERWRPVPPSRSFLTSSPSGRKSNSPSGRMPEPLRPCISRPAPLQCKS
jgi:hypothetical protein